MIKDMWNSFPRLMEDKINGLLDEAEPSPGKAFQLYKVCQSESLWSASYEEFAAHLQGFFSVTRGSRRKSDLDRFLERPMSALTFKEFHLNFRNALVDRGDLISIASWAHNLIRVAQKTTSEVISTDVLTRALNYITHPPLFEKSQNIEFEDFLSAWEKSVFYLFGKKYDPELKLILKELRWLDEQTKVAQETNDKAVLHNTIYMTQTEIDWTAAVYKAVEEDKPVPKFPLSRGPEKPRLIELERAVNLYKIVQTTKMTEFKQHRDNIRATILDRCEGLLRDKAS